MFAAPVDALSTLIVGPYMRLFLCGRDANQPSQLHAMSLKQVAALPWSNSAFCHVSTPWAVKEEYCDGCHTPLLCYAFKGEKICSNHPGQDIVCARSFSIVTQNLTTHAYDTSASACNTRVCLLIIRIDITEEDQALHAIPRQSLTLMPNENASPSQQDVDLYGLSYSIQLRTRPERDGSKIC